MPASRPHPRPRAARRNAVPPTYHAGRALLVIDEMPLKRVAWAEFHAARKRQEKAARDLHRHEEIDGPAYETWLHRTFPTLITTLREMHQEVFAKGQRVQAVLSAAAFTGRSARKLWREQKEYEANPEAFKDTDDRRRRDEGRDAFRDTEDDFFRGDDDGDDFGAEWYDESFARGDGDSKRARPAATARDVYRRLVQRLHPDRGGEWTAVRQRLWHEVQLAWSAADADWLMRLEIEWESANDMLSLASPLSRLRAAIHELHAARRDIERKLRVYRSAPAWRFTLALKKRDELHRHTESNFHRELASLQRQLTHLNATIARWEEPPRTHRRPRACHVEVRFFE